MPVDDCEPSRAKPPAPRVTPTISIIGAGRLGTAFALAFSRRGYVVQALVCRSARSARRAAKMAGVASRTLALQELSLLPRSDILLLTTPDDELSNVAKLLAAGISRGRRQRIALHSSGALPSDILGDLSSVGFSIGSMHPLISVSNPESGARRLKGAYFGIEGQVAATRTARRLVSAIGAKSFPIAASDKALYHAAAVTSSGNVVALVDIAIEMLVRCGLTQSYARTVLIPLLESTIENLSSRDTGKALTGPFARSDVATVRRHLPAIARSEVTDALNAYLLLGRHALSIMERSSLSLTPNNELESMLDEFESGK
ncbi:MAG: hypothetical protein QOH96_3641 [Blastocatellia bacterium]|nr:hypothetical protein [Blastocatellia bacterium]